MDGLELLALNDPNGRDLAPLDLGVVDGVRRIVEDGTAPNTRKAYAADMRYIYGWCGARSRVPALPLPSPAVVEFIVDHVEGMPDDVERAMVVLGHKKDFGPTSISTLRRRLSTLSVAHKTAGLPNPLDDPQVKDLLKRAGRAAVRRGWIRNKKAAAPRDVLDRMIETCSPGTLRDIRDEALLLFGWASGGRRRSEVAAATVERLEERGEDFVYLLGQTKTFQDGDSGYVPVAGRAATAMRLWLAVSAVKAGPIFRAIAHGDLISDTGLNDKTVARIVKARARAAGFDPARFGGHSLRSGFLTQAGLSNVNLAEAMEMSMHSDLKTAAGYYQAGAALHNKGARLAG